MFLITKSSKQRLDETAILRQNKALGSLQAESRAQNGIKNTFLIPLGYNNRPQKSSLSEPIRWITTAVGQEVRVLHLLATDSPFQSDNVETADKQANLQGDMVWPTNKEVNGCLITVRQDRKQDRQASSLQDRSND